MQKTIVSTAWMISGALVLVPWFSKDAQAFQCAASPKARQIPFDLVGNIVCLKVGVNGSAPLSFVLDSGGETQVDRVQAERLGLPLENYPAALNLPADFRRARGLSFSLGGSLPAGDLADQTAAVTALDAAQLVHSGRHLQGILGYSFFSQFVIEIDYAAKVVTLYDPKTYQYTGSGEIVPIMLSRLPYVRAKITTSGGETIERVLLIDSGSQETLNYETERFPTKTIEQEVLDMTNQLTSKMKPSFGRVKSLEVGGFVLNNLVAGPAHSWAIPSLPGAATFSAKGLIGGGALRRFKVVFDYSRQRMILEPNEHFHAPFEFDMSGAFLISDLPDSDGFKVFSVMPKTPASEAGLRAGDVIVAIDGEPAPTLGLARVQYDLFRQEGRRCRLTVRRKNERLEASIQLRRLI
jgi:hypothetical protein